MQSETECNGGANSWQDAQRLFGLMKRYLEGNANAYFMWNMVLDETGMSTWNWRQNSMITVNRATSQVTFNGEYYVVRHFSQFVKPGAKRVLTTGLWGDKIAFENPDGSMVLVMGNSL
jgi:glucosylceramidase